MATVHRVTGEYVLVSVTHEYYDENLFGEPKHVCGTPTNTHSPATL